MAAPTSLPARSPALACPPALQALAVRYLLFLSLSLLFHQVSLWAGADSTDLLQLAAAYACALDISSDAAAGGAAMASTNQVHKYSC